MTRRREAVTHSWHHARMHCACTDVGASFRSSRMCMHAGGRPWRQVGFAARMCMHRCPDHACITQHSRPYNQPGIACQQHSLRPGTCGPCTRRHRCLCLYTSVQACHAMAARTAGLDARWKCCEQHHACASAGGAARMYACAARVCARATRCGMCTCKWPHGMGWLHACVRQEQRAPCTPTRRAACMHKPLQEQRASRPHVQCGAAQSLSQPAMLQGTRGVSPGRAMGGCAVLEVEGV